MSMTLYGQGGGLLAGYDPSSSIFAGMTVPQLQAALTAAQAAYIALSTGGKPVTVSYAQSDGAKSVTYSPAQAAQLSGLIIQLQRQLGIPTRGRAPMRPIYR